MKIHSLAIVVLLVDVFGSSSAHDDAGRGGGTTNKGGVDGVSSSRVRGARGTRKADDGTRTTTFVAEKEEEEEEARRRLPTKKGGPPGDDGPGIAKDGPMNMNGGGERGCPRVDVDTVEYNVVDEYTYRPINEQLCNDNSECPDPSDCCARINLYGAIVHPFCVPYYCPLISNRNTECIPAPTYDTFNIEDNAAARGGGNNNNEAGEDLKAAAVAHEHAAANYEIAAHEYEEAAAMMEEEGGH